MKLIMQNLMAILALSLTARADITDSYRQQNAVVLYEFNETTGLIKDTSSVSPALDLEIYYPNSVVRSAGSLEIIEPNVIRSVSTADKIVSRCQASGAVSVELDIENNESVEKRSGNDSQRRPQPLRILSMSKGLFDRNLVLGQFYDMGNQYMAGIATSTNENEGNNKGNSLRDPLVSKTTAVLLPTPENPSASRRQKVVVTLGPSGVAKLYLSDRNGNMYLAETSTQGFGTATAATYMSGWRTGTYLGLGNEPMSRQEATANMSLKTNFLGCDRNRDASDQCFTNPNRFWKGKFHRVAIYCREVAREDVLGSGTQNILTNKSLDIDANSTISDIRKKAHEIYTRIAGVKTPITNPILNDMEQLLSNGDAVGAAEIATHESSFYNITVRDFAAKMSNREETINVPLNDFTATVIGFTRDNLNAQKLLTDNIVYRADPAQAPVPSDVVDDMLRSNNHYEALSTGRYDLQKVLKAYPQKFFNGTAAVEDGRLYAGLLTTRQWMAAHAIAGTNRRLVEYSLKQFTCRPLESVAEKDGPDNVIGPDIDIFPGGSHTKYTSSCRACHTIMDGFRPAFARWTFSNSFAKNALLVPKIGMNDDEDTSMGMMMKPDNIAYKLNKNETVNDKGRITINEEWVNNVAITQRTTDPNYVDPFKWTKLKGKGAREFGQMLSESQMFPRCMAERVFKQVCKREPASVDEAMLNKVSKEFSADRGYNLRYLFQRIVTTPECLGGN